MTVAAQMHTTVENLGALFGSHIRLARIELQDDAQWFGRRLSVVLAFAALVVVGYTFLCVAAAIALAQVTSVLVGVVGVGIANLVAGVVGVGVAANQLRRREMLTQSVRELERTSSLAASPIAGAT